MQKRNQDYIQRRKALRPVEVAAIKALRSVHFLSTKKNENYFKVSVRHDRHNGFILEAYIHGIGYINDKDPDQLAKKVYAALFPVISDAEFAKS